MKPSRQSQNCAERCGFRFADGESFLSRIVSGDETWINHFERQTKKKKSQWNGVIQHFSWKKKFRATHSAGNVVDAVIRMHKE
jgi:hypothetical protein